MTDKKPTVTRRIVNTEPEPHLQLPSRVHRPGQPAPTLVGVDYSEIEKRYMAHYAVELGKDMPRKIGKAPELAMPYGAEAKQEPTYERFLCLNGEFEGRGLIVPMPANSAWGYSLHTMHDGMRVAITKEPEACSVS